MSHNSHSSSTEPKDRDSGACQERVLSSELVGFRIDVALTQILPKISRSYVSTLLKDGAILINGKQAKPSYKVRGGERVEIEWPEPETIEAKPESIPLSIIYEDSDLVAVNKPARMVTHPSAGHTQGTLVNALLAHCNDLSTINGCLRPGIVHRLDRDTSGILLAAKNDRAHQTLQEQFAARTVRKQYVALCHGAPAQATFTCTGRIGRHPTRRTEMTVLRGTDEGREAHTDFEVLQRFPLPSQKPQTKPNPEPFFLVLARPKTGRTHQIRVHLAKAGFPVLADPLYGRETSLPELDLSRHALHAWKIEFEHPRTAKKMHLCAPLADDIKRALRMLGGHWVEE